MSRLMKLALVAVAVVFTAQPAAAQVALTGENEASAGPTIGESALSSGYQTVRGVAAGLHTRGEVLRAMRILEDFGDFALASHDAAEAAAAYLDAAEAAAAYLDAAWIAIAEVKRSDRQARHPYLAALYYGAIGRYRALDRERAALVEEAERLVNEAFQLAESAALGEAQREAILARVEAFQEVGVAG